MASNDDKSNQSICNADGQPLSALTDFERSDVSLRTRQPNSALRPVVIDGPLVGMSYDTTYRPDPRLRPYWWRKMESRAQASHHLSGTQYPIQALYKLLFYFIARGHRTTAFLPQFYGDLSQDDMVPLDAGSIISSSSYAPQQWQQLLDLGLLKMLPGEKFSAHLKHYARQCNAIMVTSTRARYVYKKDCDRQLCSSDSSSQSGEETEEESSENDYCDYDDGFDGFGHGDSIQMNGCCSVNASTPIVLHQAFVMSTRIINTRPLDCRLPVVVPLFRPYNHRLVFSPETFQWRGLFEPNAEQIGEAQFMELKRHQQLTLSRQYALLKVLNQMLADDYPRGRQDAGVLSLIKHALDIANQSKDHERS